jgi:hypothetical protein
MFLASDLLLKFGYAIGTLLIYTKLILYNFKYMPLWFYSVQLVTGNSLIVTFLIHLVTYVASINECFI